MFVIDQKGKRTRPICERCRKPFAASERQIDRLRKHLSVAVVCQPCVIAECGEPQILRRPRTDAPQGIGNPNLGRVDGEQADGPICQECQRAFSVSANEMKLLQKPGSLTLCTECGENLRARARENARLSNNAYRIWEEQQQHAG